LDENYFYMSCDENYELSSKALLQYNISDGFEREDSAFGDFILQLLGSKYWIQVPAV
jgi:hypothetical protein